MINNVALTGRITKELELRSTQSGKEVLNFNLAVNRNFKNQNGEYDADFIQVIAFGQTAKFVHQYAGKGLMIGVTGRIQTRNYDNQQGQKVYVTEVVADNISLLEYKDKQQNNTSPQDFMPDSIDDSELPF